MTLLNRLGDSCNDLADGFFNCTGGFPPLGRIKDRFCDEFQKKKPLEYDSLVHYAHHVQDGDEASARNQLFGRRIAYVLFPLSVVAGLVVTVTGEIYRDERSNYHWLHAMKEKIQHEKLAEQAQTPEVEAENNELAIGWQKIESRSKRELSGAKPLMMAYFGSMLITASLSSIAYLREKRMLEQGK